MSSDPMLAELVEHHLQAGINELELAARGGRHHTMCIRSLGGAAKLLGYDTIAERATQLLRVAPDEAFFAGVITNIERPERFHARFRTIDSHEVLEKQHPVYIPEERIERIRSSASDEKHFALCLEGRFHEARDVAGSGVRLEEVGDLLAVLGEFDSARSVACDPNLQAFRQRGVRFVLVIELFRRGRAAEAGLLLAEMESAGLDASERVHIALGFAGREPWGGYPFPDW